MEHVAAAGAHHYNVGMAWLDETPRAGPAGDPVSRATAAVCRRDPVVARLAEVHGPCTLRPAGDYFHILVETIISQQLSTAAARTIYKRLVDLARTEDRPRRGRRALRPARILSLRDRDLRACGLSGQKVAYLRNVSEWWMARRRGPRFWAALSDEEITVDLTSVKGVGQWSADMFLIFALNRLDVFPVGDLGMRNAMKKNYKLRGSPPLSRFERIATAWKPYRTIGTWYMWESYDNPPAI